MKIMSAWNLVRSLVIIPILYAAMVMAIIWTAGNLGLFNSPASTAILAYLSGAVTLVLAVVCRWTHQLQMHKIEQRIMYRLKRRENQAEQTP